MEPQLDTAVIEHSVQLATNCKARLRRIFAYAASPSPHPGNPDQQTPAAAVQQNWLVAAPAPNPQAMRQQGVNDAERADCTATTPKS